MGRCLVSCLPTVLLTLSWSLVTTGTAARADDERLGRVLFPGESPEASRRLEAVRKLVRDQSWADAVEAYQRLLDTAGDELVSLSPDHCLQVRFLCHRDLAALPAETLRLYRDRVEGQARNWLKQALANREERLLRRVVDEAFCSREGATALDALGDLAFERGRFDEAEHWWRQLVSPVTGAGPADPCALVYPGDPTVDVALVWAKQFLARILRGERDAVARELPAFVRLHGTAEGQLAGRKGKYAEILAEVARHPGPVALHSARDTWRTLAADPSRNGRVPRDPADPRHLRLLCLDGPTWTFNLQTHALVEWEQDTRRPARKVLSDSAAARSLAFQPVIVQNQVLVADARSVTAYDARTGRSSVWYDLRSKRPGPAVNLSLPAPSELRYTLSVGEGLVLARLGVQALRDPAETAGAGARGRPFDRESFLVCLSPEPDPKCERVRWEVPAAGPDRPAAVFEGAPVVQDGRVYIAATRFRGNETITAVHCYPLHADTTAPLPLWHQDVCAIRDEDAAQPRYRHHLLTMAGPLVVYASHSGAIVALDAVTGRHVWGMRYPSGGSTTSVNKLQPRDLAPAVSAEGRLFAAPADYDRLFCLDASTGRTLWERDRIDVVHLLGAGQDRLIFTTPDGIRAVSAKTGADLDGWYQPNAGGQWAPYGRGFLLGDLVFWPTARFGLQVLQQEDGQPPLDLDLVALQRVRRGNLAFADGCLAVADTEQLTLYASPSLLRSRREQEVRLDPASPVAHWHLAVAEADAGLLDQANTEFREVETLAGAAWRWQGRDLAGLARALRHETWLALAERAAAEDRVESAVNALTTAAAAEYRVAERLRALEQLVHLWAMRGQAERALGVWQKILDDPALRRGHLPDEHGNSQTAALEAAVRMARLRDKQTRTPPERPPPGVPPRPSGEGRTAHPEPLSVPLRRVSQFSLAPGEHLLLAEGEPGGLAEQVPESGDWFFARGSELTCRDPFTGQVRWSRPLALVPRWIGRWTGGVLVGGPEGVLRLRPVDGQIQWEFLLSERASPDSAGPADALSAFQQRGSHLFCLQGDRRLLALDAETGRVLWSCWAPGGRRLPVGQGGGFMKPYRATPRLVVIQLASGYVWALDAANGRRLHESFSGEEPAGGKPTQRTPFTAEDTEGRRGVSPTVPPIIAVPQMRTIEGRDGTNGELLWKHVLHAATTLRGIRPRVIEGSRCLLLAIPRNYSWTLRCLDRQTGQVQWPQEILLGTDDAAAQSLTLDETASYFVSRNVLHCLSIKDGTLLWSQLLPGAGLSCRVRIVRGGYLLAWRSDPTMLHGELRWLCGTVRYTFARTSAKPAESFQVEIRDRTNGRLVQRLNIASQTPPPIIQAHLDPRLAFRPEWRHVWPDGDGSVPAVLAGSAGIGVVAGGSASLFENRSSEP